MKIKFSLLILLMFFYIPLLSAQKQIVYECQEKHLIKDMSLQQAINKSIANISSIELQAEDFSCAHYKYISNAFWRTFNFKIFNIASGYSFFLLKNGENSFSIDMFLFKDKQVANAVEKKVRQRKISNLKIESLTYYDFFSSENRLVFFIADRQSFSENQALFKTIKENYLLDQANQASKVGPSLMH